MTLPPIVSEISDVLSLLGFLVTLFVAHQTRAIKKKFFSRVRLGEVLPELRQAAELYISSLLEWQNSGDQSGAIQKFDMVRGLLKSAQSKVKDKELREINSALGLMWTNRYIFLRRNIADIPFNECWEIAARVNMVVIMLDQRVKDLNWAGEA
ncbi:hypothetical protein [Pseudomonas nitroreducens]|uniref:hypothetical protein n=1 Tax=Pseudomonas nitroreducens TaxID=46680 RepID=UPI003D28DEFD